MNRLLVVISLTLLVGCSSSRELRVSVGLPSELGPRTLVPTTMTGDGTGEVVHSSSRTDQAEPRAAVVPRSDLVTDFDRQELLLIGARMTKIDRSACIPEDYSMRAMLTAPKRFESLSAFMSRWGFEPPCNGRMYDLDSILFAALRQLRENMR